MYHFKMRNLLVFVVLLSAFSILSSEATNLFCGGTFISSVCSHFKSKDQNPGYIDFISKQFKENKLTPAGPFATSIFYGPYEIKLPWADKNKDYIILGYGYTSELTQGYLIWICRFNKGHKLKNGQKFEKGSFTITSAGKGFDSIEQYFVYSFPNEYKKLVTGAARLMTFQVFEVTNNDATKNDILEGIKFTDQNRIYTDADNPLPKLKQYAEIKSVFQLLYFEIAYEPSAEQINAAVQRLTEERKPINK